MVKRIMDMIFRRVQFYDAVTVSFSVYIISLLALEILVSLKMFEILVWIYTKGVNNTLELIMVIMVVFYIFEWCHK